MSVLASYEKLGSTELCYIAAVKGAPETLHPMVSAPAGLGGGTGRGGRSPPTLLPLQFAQCPADYHHIHTEISREGARVLALGYKELGHLTHQQVRLGPPWVGRYDPPVPLPGSLGGLLVCPFPCLRCGSGSFALQLGEPSRTLGSIFTSGLLPSVPLPQPAPFFLGLLGGPRPVPRPAFPQCPCEPLPSAQRPHTALSLWLPEAAGRARR